MGVAACGLPDGHGAADSGSGGLDGTILYLACCHSGDGDGDIDVLLSTGVECVFVVKGEINSGYETTMCRTICEKMAGDESCTALQALEKAKQAHRATSNRHPYWWDSLFRFLDGVSDSRIEVYGFTSTTLRQRESGLIRGIITRASRYGDGEPLRGVTVAARPVSNPDCDCIITKTDEYGVYCAAVPAGAYRLTFTLDGYLSVVRSVRAETGAVSELSLELLMGKSTRDTGTAAGWVYDWATYSPLPDREICFYRDTAAESPASAPVKVVRTNGSGYYEAVLPIGRYTARVFDPEGVFAEEAFPITVQTGLPVDGSLWLTRAVPDKFYLKVSWDKKYDIVPVLTGISQYPSEELKTGYKGPYTEDTSQFLIDKSSTECSINGIPVVSCTYTSGSDRITAVFELIPEMTRDGGPAQMPVYDLSLYREDGKPLSAAAPRIEVCYGDEWHTILPDSVFANPQTQSSGWEVLSIRDGCVRALNRFYTYKGAYPDNYATGKEGGTLLWSRDDGDLVISLDCVQSDLSWDYSCPTGGTVTFSRQTADGYEPFRTLSLPRAYAEIRLPGGTYRMDVECPGMVKHSELVTVIPREAAYRTVLMLKAGKTGTTGTAAGVIRDVILDTGIECASLEVYRGWNVTDRGAESVLHTVTAADGSYALTLPYGYYTVSVMHMDYRETRFNIIVQDGTTTGQDARMTPTDGIGIEFIVTWSDAGTRLQAVMRNGYVFDWIEYMSGYDYESELSERFRVSVWEPEGGTDGQTACRHVDAGKLSQTITLIPQPGQTYLFSVYRQGGSRSFEDVRAHVTVSYKGRVLGEYDPTPEDEDYVWEGRPALGWFPVCFEYASPWEVGRYDFFNRFYGAGCGGSYDGGWYPTGEGR